MNLHYTREMLFREIPSNIHEFLRKTGINRVINCFGTYTLIGGHIFSDYVRTHVRAGIVTRLYDTGEVPEELGRISLNIVLEHKPEEIEKMVKELM